MTDEELKAIEMRVQSVENPYDAAEVHARDVLALVAEVRRLRGLIKQAGNCGHCCEHCAFCGAGQATDNGWDGEKVVHSAKCPAFTPDGAVR